MGTSSSKPETIPSVSVPGQRSAKDVTKEPLIKSYINPLTFIQLFKNYDISNGIKLFPMIERPAVEGPARYSDEKQFFEKLLSKYETDEPVFKQDINRSFSHILVDFLRYFMKVPLEATCSESLRYVSSIAILSINSNGEFVLEGTGSPRQTVYTAIITPDDIDEYIKKKYSTPSFPLLRFQSDLKEKLLLEYKFLQDNATVSQIEAIQLELEVCGSKYYILELGDYRAIDKGAHSNLIIIDRTDKKIFYIEPQFYGTDNDTFRQTMLNYVERKKLFFKKFLKLVDIEDYTVIYPVSAAPQSIAEDRNCLFWTFLITCVFLLNPEVTSIDKISTAIIQKYPTKEKLLEYIDNFKFMLYTIKNASEDIQTPLIKPQGTIKAGKRKNKSKFKNHKTRKHTKPKKRS